jgi:enoyl-[acyl-carrier-protein] reductase (NADH)
MGEEYFVSTPNTAAPIRLLLVDDQTLIRQGLKTMLELEPDLQVVGIAPNGEIASKLEDAAQKLNQLDRIQIVPGDITAMVKNLSVELAADNIRINAVAPGIVLTPLLGDVNNEMVEHLNQQQPLGRVGIPKDIADAVLYLANASWVTGVILSVDGGGDASGDGTNNLNV